LQEVKQRNRGVGYPLPSGTQVEERIEVDFYFPCMLCLLREWTVIETTCYWYLVIQIKLLIYGAKYEDGEWKRTNRELEELSKGENIVKWLKVKLAGSSVEIGGG
jgi:hypothetical protein